MDTWRKRREQMSMMVKNKNHGFAMLEVMVTLMIGLMLISTFYLLIRMEYLQVLAGIQEKEAYYAAVSAVRMMEEAVMYGEYEEGSAAYALTYGDGMEKYETRILFESDEEDDGRNVEIPVEIWSEREENELLLSARATRGGKIKVVSLRMVKIIEKFEDNVENYEETELWIPIEYNCGI